MKEIKKNLFIKLKKIQGFFKENPIMSIVLVIVAIGLISILILFAKEIIAIIGLGVVLVIVYFDDIKKISDKGTIQRQNLEQIIEYNRCASASALYDVFTEKHKILEIECPLSIHEIFPTNYSNVQYIGGQPFYRFIVAHNCNVNEVDLKIKKALLQEIISQRLQGCLFDNIFQVSYFDIPYLYVLKIQNDRYNPNYYAIDIMVVDNNEKANLIKSFNKQKQYDGEKPYNAVPIDEDF